MKLYVFFSENSILKKHYRSNLGFYRWNSGCQLMDSNFKRIKKSQKKIQKHLYGLGLPSPSPTSTKIYRLEYGSPSPY
jgi:hypothetical protein